MFEDFVYMIPMNLLVDEVLYQDKRTIFREIFDKEKISSSLLNDDQIKNFIEPISRSYKNVIVLTVSSKMSGLHERFKSATSKFENVKIIDTKLNSVEEGIVAYKAMQLVKENRTISEIESQIDEIISKTKIFVSVSKLDAIIKSGRLNDKIGWFMKKIGFLPLITINDKG